MSGDSYNFYTDYDKEPLEIYEEPNFIVLDPWAGKEIGTFGTRKDAELFVKAVVKRWRKRKNT